VACRTPDDRPALVGILAAGLPALPRREGERQLRLAEHWWVAQALPPLLPGLHQRNRGHAEYQGVNHRSQQFPPGLRGASLEEGHLCRHGLGLTQRHTVQRQSQSQAPALTPDLINTIVQLLGIA